MKEEGCLIYLYTTLVGVFCQEFRGDLNYHTETPSPPTILPMVGPTHVLVHVNPGVHKNYADKVVDYYDKPNLTDFTAFCRCWRSKDFPYCDGGHHRHNQLVGDNVGPILIRRRNVTGAARFYRRMRKLGINSSDAGTPEMCSQTLYPITPRPKPRRPIMDEDIDVDAMLEENKNAIFNFTNYLDDFIHMEERMTEYVPSPTIPTTEPEPTLWFPTFRQHRYNPNAPRELQYDSTY